MRKVSSAEMARIKRRIVESFARTRTEIPGYLPPSIRGH